MRQHLLLYNILALFSPVVLCYYVLRPQLHSTATTLPAVVCIHDYTIVVCFYLYTCPRSTLPYYKILQCTSAHACMPTLLYIQQLDLLQLMKKNAHEYSYKCTYLRCFVEPFRVHIAPHTDQFSISLEFCSLFASYNIKPTITSALAASCNCRLVLVCMHLFADVCKLSCKIVYMIAVCYVSAHRSRTLAAMFSE
jgi:hypothetical protein